MDRKPIREPIQKSPRKAARRGRPYLPNLRRSIRDMIRAGIAVQRKDRAFSDAKSQRRELRDCRSLGAPVGDQCQSLRPIRGSPWRSTIARKISTRHPARIPLGPRKTVLFRLYRDFRRCGGRDWFGVGHDLSGGGIIVRKAGGTGYELTQHVWSRRTLVLRVAQDDKSVW